MSTFFYRDYEIENSINNQLTSENKDSTNTRTILNVSQPEGRGPSRGHRIISRKGKKHVLWDKIYVSVISDIFLSEFL